MSGWIAGHRREVGWATFAFLLTVAPTILVAALEPPVLWPLLAYGLIVGAAGFGGGYVARWITEERRS